MFMTQGFLFGFGASLLFLVENGFPPDCCMRLMLILLTARSNGSILVVQEEKRISNWYCLWRCRSRLCCHRPLS
jgi:hypothetical protein